MQSQRRASAARENTKSSTPRNSLFILVFRATLQMTLVWSQFGMTRGLSAIHFVSERQLTNRRCTSWITGRCSYASLHPPRVVEQRLGS
jgi:hypothetical protein